jgi:hypothetical protein
VGAYRFWRDAGLVAGALLAGVAADGVGMAASIALVGILTALSGVWVALARLERSAPAMARIASEV